MGILYGPRLDHIVQIRWFSGDIVCHFHLISSRISPVSFFFFSNSGPCQGQEQGGQMQTRERLLIPQYRLLTPLTWLISYPLFPSISSILFNATHNPSQSITTLVTILVTNVLRMITIMVIQHCRACRQWLSHHQSSLFITISDGLVTGIHIHNRVGQKRDPQNIIDIAVPHISMVRTFRDCESYNALQVHFHQIIVSILTPQSVCESALST